MIILNKLFLKLFNFCLIFTFLLFPNIFSIDSIFSDSLTLEIEHSLGIDIEKNYDKGVIESLDLISYYTILNNPPYQKINNFQIFPSFVNYEISKDSHSEKIRYKFTNKDLKSFQTQLNTFEVEVLKRYEIESMATFPKINSYNFYPLESELLEENSKYLQFTEMINTNQELQQKAFELAYGEDDVFVIATKIANWLEQEIEYDLSTIFENPNQNAIEIFNSKRGVCKELSIIYISMLRSLQIPSRVVLGYAYTNSQEIIDFVGSNWGGHAWVEVLIGDKWVPFDLAYRQYGFVGSTHIAFQKNYDINDLGILVEMSSRGFDFNPNSLFSNVEIEIIDSKYSNLNESTQINAKINLEFEEFQSSSYIFLEVELENPHSHYLAQEIQLIFPNELESITNSQKLLTIKPKSLKKIGFILKVPDNFDNFILPISLYSTSNLELRELDQVKIITRQQGALLTRDYVELKQKELGEFNQMKNKEQTDNLLEGILKNNEDLENTKSVGKNNTTQNFSLNETIYDIISKTISNSPDIINLNCNIIFEFDSSETFFRNLSRQEFENIPLLLECDLQMLLEEVKHEFERNNFEIDNNSLFTINLCSKNCTSKSVSLYGLFNNSLNLKIRVLWAIQMSSIMRFGPVSIPIKTNFTEINFESLNQVYDIDMNDNKIQFQKLIDEDVENIYLHLEVIDVSDSQLVAYNKVLSLKNGSVELDLDIGEYDFHITLFHYNKPIEENIRTIRITQKKSDNQILSFLNLIINSISNFFISLF
ncbi:MAG: transglutaminase-like domain-containing protein [Candidatus Woesearchaeota archaeon]